MAKGYLYDNGDELITREDVNEVPDSSTAHAGDVLELDSNKKPKWTAPASGLPDATSASVGDVLSLDSDKSPVWSAPSGGGGGIECYVDFEATPVTYDGDDYYPVKKKIDDSVLTGEFVFNNVDKNIYITFLEETSEVDPEVGTIVITNKGVIYVLGIQKQEAGQDVIYVSCYYTQDSQKVVYCDYSKFNNFNIYVSGAK